jgi:hypothetical protein
MIDWERFLYPWKVLLVSVARKSRLLPSGVPASGARMLALAQISRRILPVALNFVNI